MKSVTFILPGQGTKPAGGFKVVYEYANYLSEHDWEVRIIHIAWLNNAVSIFKGVVKYFVFFFSYKPSKWFLLHEKIKVSWVFKLKKIHTEKIIATTWETAELLNILNKNNNFDIYYLIQGDESKFDEVVKRNRQERVYATWKYKWKIIAVTDFLFMLIMQHNKNLIKISNGIDFNKYRISNPVEYRNKFSVCMLGHVFELKGTKTGIEAFKILKDKYPDLQVTVFSVYPKMSYIPDWIDYEYMASQDKIVDMYNQSALFVSCSYTEGFGLPLVEAMACGCAAVVSDIPAYRDIASETTSLYFEAGDTDALVRNIELLFNNDEKRIEYAYNGNLHVKNTLSFDNSASSFEKYISE